jgi:Domain of unknown function (DUF5659)
MKTALTQQQHPAEFKSRDLYLSTIIRQSGIPILRVETNGRQGIFVFQHSQQIERIVTKFLNGELLVEPRGLFENFKSLKSLAYAAINDVR